jgi:aminopeptidase
MRIVVLVLVTLCAAATSVMGAAPVERHADVLLRYSVDLKAGEHLVLVCGPESEELNEAVYRGAVKVGALVTVLNSLRHEREIDLREGSDEALRWVSPAWKAAMETADALIIVGAPENTRAAAGIDPARLAASKEREGELDRIWWPRVSRGELKWVYTQHPTAARAQQAGMGSLDYQDFVYGSMRLDEEDPVAAWSQQREVQSGYIARFDGGKQVRLTGSNVDLTLSIDGRTFISACGKSNFPDGEIFTSPVEDSVDGWVRFSYPVIEQDQVIEDLRLWFEGGRVTRFEAGSGGEYLETILAVDDGAPVVGELGIGTNPGIDRFTENMLFDEKMSGTIHLALGGGFPRAGGTNESKIHMDMLVDMTDGVIEVDGQRVYENGRFIE